MKKKSLIICYDFETCTEGEMLPYMVVFSFMFYNLTEDEKFTIGHDMDLVAERNRCIYRDEKFYWITTSREQQIDPKKLCEMFLDRIDLCRSLLNLKIDI